MTERKGSHKPSKAASDGDLGAIDRALKLVQALPPSEATWNYGEREARTAFEARLKPILDHLDALCERHLPEARIPSPCGQSRFGNTLCRPWVNLLGCHDLCGRCREQALRALRLLREALVDGKPSERFMEPEIVAALIERATRALEWERRLGEQSTNRLRSQLERMRRPFGAQKENPHAPGLTDLQRAVLRVLVQARPGHPVIGKDLLSELDKTSDRRGLSQGNLTSRVIPKLVEKGVPIENAHPGYWIDWARAPAWIEAMRSNGGAMTGQT